MSLRFLLRDVVNIGARGHKLHREYASDHGLARMQYVKSVGVLVVVFLLLQDRPDFFRRKITSPLHEFIGHLGPAIGKAIEGIIGSVFDQILLGEC